MRLDQTSLPELKHKDQEGRKIEEHPLTQLVKCARQEWETFHLQHPTVDEKTFYEAQRFCVKQWVLQKGTVLSNLAAFERAHKHFEGEVLERADELQITSMMMEDSYQEARSLGVHIAAQAQQRSSQAREAIGELSSEKVPYLISKVKRIRAPGQAQDRAKHAEERAERVRQDVEMIKSLGIAREYENQKVNLKKRGEEVLEHLNHARQLVRESQRQANAAEYCIIFESQKKSLSTFLENIHYHMFEDQHAQDAAGTVTSDWDAATHQAKDLHDLAGFVEGIQEAITDALAKAKAEIAQAKGTHQRVQKVQQALERTRKRWADIDKWAPEQMIQAEQRKKHAERFVQTKTIETFIANEEQLQQAIETARSKTKKALETLENIGASLKQMKDHQVRIAQRHVQFAKSLEKVKDALERATCAGETSAKAAQHAHDQQTMVRALSVRGAEAKKVQEQARSSAKGEMEAYSHAKTSLGYAIRYSREIASEYRKGEATASMVAKHFAAFLKGHLPWEKDVLNHAITAVKNIVKTSLHVIKQEKHATEAARQTAAALETAGDGNLSQFTASEQEALLQAAFANDTLAQCAASYCMFHKLAANVGKEHLTTMKDQWQASLEVVTTYLDEIKPEKERQDVQRQRAASAKFQSQAHLLIDEQTGAISLKEGMAAFSFQDLAGIAEADPQANPSQSRLLFKGGHPWSSYDVPHDLLYETSGSRTMIHLQVPDGAGKHRAMLSLPNGTQIKLADIDLEKTEHDPLKPERGVTITLKQDGGKINLLVAASVMRELMQEALLNFVDKSLDENINCIRDAVGIKRIEAIQEAFEDAKIDDRDRRYLDTYLFSSEEVEKRYKDHGEWVDSILDAAEHIICKLREYGDEVLKDEHGAKEITDVEVLEGVVLGDIYHELYQKRDACLQKIARGKGCDRSIICPFLEHPDDDSPAMDLSLNGREVLAEYERAKACQRAEQGQDPAGCRPSDKWSSYLARLRCCILDEAPAYFRTAFLVYQIKEAVEAGNLEQGTPDDPGVSSLAQELAREPSAAHGQGSEGGGDNDYAREVEVLTQRVVAGVQDAVKTADPCEIVSRVTLLDYVYRVIEYTEGRLEGALDRTTSTVAARAVVGQIGNGIVDQRVRQHR